MFFLTNFSFMTGVIVLSCSRIRSVTGAMWSGYRGDDGTSVFTMRMASSYPFKESSSFWKHSIYWRRRRFSDMFSVHWFNSDMSSEDMLNLGTWRRLYLDTIFLLFFCASIMPRVLPSFMTIFETRCFNIWLFSMILRASCTFSCLPFFSISMHLTSPVKPSNPVAYGLEGEELSVTCDFY